MNTTHRHSDALSGLVLETHSLRRQVGQMIRVQRTVPAPADLDVDMIGVPEDSPLELDLRLESVGEGVLATGTVEATLEGECSRCLDPIKEELLLDVQELYFYPDKEADEDASRVSAEETIDLDPVVRAAVVLNLPFSPLCRDDCGGLCPDCGANLNDDPDHDHPDRIDPRWSALEGRPAWVDPIRMVMIRVVIEVGTTVWAQPTAVIATQRAERKVQHDRGTHHGVKVDSLLGTNPTGILVGLLVGVEVQLLDVKEKFLLDGVQTARALPLQGGLDGPGREDPLSNRLQAEIKFEWRVLGNANHVDIEIRWSGYRPLNPDHLTHLPTQRMGLENETRKRVGVAMGGVHRKDPFDQWNTTRS